MRTVLRTGMLALSVLFLHAGVFSQQVAKSIPNSTSPDGRIGFLEFTPTDYGSQKHPLIIFLHGIGERGNGSSQVKSVAANAIPYYCARGASMRFTVNGVTSSFVVLSPQLSTSYGYWPTFYVKEMIKYAKANLRIDPNRIYLCGLSLGGGGIWRVITDTENFDHTFDAGIAAAAPVCGTQEENDADFATTIGTNRLPIWAFHSMDDPRVSVGATQHAEILGNILGIKNPAMKFTYYQTGGHAGAWIHAFDTGHITVPVVVNGKVTKFTANPNLYEWFLSNSRSKAGNTPPVAYAGSAQTLTLPLSITTLTGSGTGTGGASIVSYSWAQTSGPAGGTISLPLLNTTTVIGLIQGVYVFTLTVKDNHGLSSTSSVTVTVNAPNTAPQASAGNAQTVTLPTSTVKLSGTATGTNGATISSYAWAQASGPSTAVIANPAAAATAVSRLIQGVYVFTLSVKDNHGLVTVSRVAVTVNGASYTSPAATAGAAQSITLPTSSINLKGSGKGTGGALISAYSWTQASGPSTAVIASPTTAGTLVSRLVQGVYIFTLTVKDNHGLSVSSNTSVTVNAGYTAPLVLASTSTQTITLPVNTASLTGKALGTNGATISSYAWVKKSGPAAGVISTPKATNTTVTGLVAGVYAFTLTIKDNHGLTSSSTIGVTVKPGTYTAPVVSAGNAQTITLPVNTVTLPGRGTGTGGALIYTYGWTKTSGPTAGKISAPTAANTTVTGLVQGTYVFTLTVKDNHGLSGNASVSIKVNAAVVVSKPSTPAPEPAEIIGYIKQSVGQPQACADASVSGRTPIYSSSIANGSIVYTDAAKKKIFNGGYNWFSFTSTSGGKVTKAFAVFPDGVIHLLADCANPVTTPTAPVTSHPAAGKLLGYIKRSTGPYQACDDKSSTGRIAVYGKSIANGTYLYTDTGMTKKYDGGWYWYSFTPVLGGSTTYAFAVYPVGSIGLLRNCAAAGAREGSASGTTAEEDEAELRRLRDSAAALLPGETNDNRLSVYPNPVHSNATMQLYSAESGTKTINLYNTAGVLVAKYTWQTVKGSNTYALQQIAGLPSGLYIADVRDNNGKAVGKLKFIKQ